MHISFLLDCSLLCLMSDQRLVNGSTVFCADLIVAISAGLSL